MANHESKNSHEYTPLTDPTVWTPTRQSQIATASQNLKFTKDVAAHGLSGNNNEACSASPRPDGFVMFECVNYATTGHEVTLVDMDQYGGTNCGTSSELDLRYRTCHIDGTIFWSSTPNDSQPGESNDYEHKYIQVRWYSGGDQYESGQDTGMERIDAWFFTGPGCSAFDADNNRVVIENYSGTRDLYFWVDDTNGNLMMYWNGGGGSKTPSFMFHVTFGPRWND